MPAENSCKVPTDSVQNARRKMVGSQVCLAHCYKLLSVCYIAQREQPPRQGSVGSPMPGRGHTLLWSYMLSPQHMRSRAWEWDWFIIVRSWSHILKIKDQNIWASFVNPDILFTSTVWIKWIPWVNYRPCMWAHRWCLFGSATCRRKYSKFVGIQDLNNLSLRDLSQFSSLPETVS